MKKQIEEYKQGYSIRKICEKYHISRHNFSKVLKEQGIPIRMQNQTARKFYCDEKFFENISTEKQAYWLGFIMADGFIMNGRYSKYLGITLKLEDKSHLEKFKRDIKATYEIKEYSSRGYNENHKTSRILISSEKIINDLKKYGVSENKTFNEVFPSLPYNLQRHFIRGVFDGDGSVYYSKRDKCLGVHICGSQELLLNINNYFSKLGVSINIQNSRSIYDIHYSHKKALFVLNELYRDNHICLDRKFDIYKNYLKFTEK